MKVLLHALRWFENGVLTILASALLLGAAVQIVGRLLDMAPVWLDPAMRALTLWIALVGAVVASREQRQLHIDALVARMKSPWQSIVRALAALTTAVVCTFLAYASYGFFMLEAEAPSTSFGLVQSHWLAAMLPVCFALMALHSVLALFAPRATLHA